MDQIDGGVEKCQNSHFNPSERKACFVRPLQLNRGVLTKQTLFTVRTSKQGLMNLLNREVALIGALFSIFDSVANCQRLHLIWKHLFNILHSNMGQRSDITTCSLILSRRPKSKADETATV